MNHLAALLRGNSFWLKRRLIIAEQKHKISPKLSIILMLSSTVAHDFNNILTIIMGSIELSMEDVDDRPETYETMVQAFSAAQRAKDLVQQTLAFRRQTEHERKPIKVTPIVKEVLKFLRSTLPATIEIRENINLAQTLFWLILPSFIIFL